MLFWLSGSGARGCWQPDLGVLCGWLSLCALAASAEPAAPPGKDEPAFVIKSWQTRDGLPQSTVNTILQTRDGYLWVGTSGGLARFDGVRFRTFGLEDGLRSVRIATLAEDPAAGYGSGLPAGV